MRGDVGNDTPEGGFGHDTLRGEGGAGGVDRFFGGGAPIPVTFVDASARIDVDLHAREGAGTFDSVERIIGWRNSDTIGGDSADNLFQGGAGHDWPDGRSGDDALDGEASFGLGRFAGEKFSGGHDTILDFDLFADTVVIVDDYIDDDLPAFQNVQRLRVGMPPSSTGWRRSRSTTST